MIRRLGVAVLAAGIAWAGLATATAQAAPAACGDYHWIGAAGSGQRDGAGVYNYGGMGSVMYASYQQLASELAVDGKTITAESVQYPAAPVPADGSISGWLTFLGSVKDGTAATAKQLEAFTAQCPNTKVVLAGYSQGAMVIHRNLYDLADDPHVAAALLVADGDRLPVDNTIPMGTTAGLPGKGMGVAQDHSILASTNTSPLPPSIGARTISVCDVGDPVCDFDPDSDVDVMSPAVVAIHTAYAPATSGPHAWGAPLYQLVAASGPTVSGAAVPGSADLQLSAQHG